MRVGKRDSQRSLLCKSDMVRTALPPILCSSGANSHVSLLASTTIKVPPMAESISEGVLKSWSKSMHRSYFRGAIARLIRCYRGRRLHRGRRRGCYHRNRQGRSPTTLQTSHAVQGPSPNHPSHRLTLPSTRLSPALSRNSLSMKKILSPLVKNFARSTLAVPGQKKALKLQNRSPRPPLSPNMRSRSPPPLPLHHLSQSLSPPHKLPHLRPLL